MSWSEVQAEARIRLEADSFLEDLIQPYILNNPNFTTAIIHTLSLQFGGLISAEKWETLFWSVCDESTLYHEGMPTLEVMGLRDLAVIRDRDPACDGLVTPFLYFKGYKALQSHRIAHALWNAGRKDAARAIQSRCSELYAVDIHPAAIIAEGLFIDHGTGIVIGETCIIGRNCSFLHGVTLGSTGKDKGDRHPKIGNDVLIGCGTSVLGNITIGHCSKIGSGSIVLKPIPCCATAVGNPARVVGKSLCPSAAMGMDLALKYVVTEEGKSYESTWDATSFSGLHYNL
jgi:serine O-acetyltransferase